MEKMKGHKRECPWIHCSCDKCQVTEKKRAKTRVQVQQKRIKMEKAAKEQDPSRQKSEDALLKTATERESETFAQEQSKLKRKPEPLLEESPSPWKKTRLDKKPKRTWEAVLALCEDFKFHQDCYPLLHLILKDFTIEEARDKIEQATKEVAEKVSEESGRMEAGQVGPHYPWLGPHYHPLPPRAPDLQAASLYKIPPALYPRPVPFGFPFPLIRATPYGFAHTVPSTTYTIPCHEPARPSVLSYDDFQKLENKRSSPCSHHSEEPSSFNQLEI